MGQDLSQTNPGRKARVRPLRRALVLLGALCACLLSACRVPPPSPDSSVLHQEGALELLDAEVGNREIRRRQLLRRRESLAREIEREETRLAKLETQELALERRIGDARGELQKELEQLKFLEGSLASQEARAAEIRKEIAQIEADEKKLAGLRARQEALPKEIAALEKELAVLASQKQQLEAEKEQAQKSVAESPDAEAPQAEAPQAESPKAEAQQAEAAPTASPPKDAKPPAADATPKK